MQTEDHKQGAWGGGSGSHSNMTHTVINWIRPEMGGGEGNQNMSLDYSGSRRRWDNGWGGGGGGGVCGDDFDLEKRGHGLT